MPPGSLSGFGRRAKTYEEALADYRAAKEIDHFSGAHARLFSDYMTLFFRPAARISDGFRMPARPPCQNAGFDLGQKSFLPADCRRPVFLYSPSFHAPDSASGSCGYRPVRLPLYRPDSGSFAYFKYTGGWILPLS